MGICSWIMCRLYNFDANTEQIPTALIVPPFIPMFSEDHSVKMIQKYAKKWLKKRTRAAIIIQHRYEARILYKYSKLKRKIISRNIHERNDSYVAN